MTYGIWTKPGADGMVLADLAPRDWTQAELDARGGGEQIFVTLDLTTGAASGMFYNYELVTTCGLRGRGNATLRWQTLAAAWLAASNAEADVW